MLAVMPDQAKTPHSRDRLPHRHDQCMPTGSKRARALDCVLGILRSVVADQQWAVSGFDVPSRVHRECRHRQAEAVLDVLDQPSFLPVGVL